MNGVDEKAHVGVIESRDDDPVADDEGSAQVGARPPRRDKRRTNVVDLRPVKSQQAHAEARC